MAHLLLSNRDTPDSRQVERAAAMMGLSSSRCHWRLDAATRGVDDLRFYGEPLLADVVACQVDLALLEAPLDWTARLDERLLRRRVSKMMYCEARAMRFPLFVKSLDDKWPAPRVYASAEQLPSLADDHELLVSDPVHWRREIRTFVCEGEILDAAQYMGDGRPDVRSLEHADAAHQHLGALVSELAADLPPGIVIDCGLLESGWAVVEANAAWGSGLYAVDAQRALPAILASSGPRSKLDASWERFVRASAHVQFS